eukprot:403335908
MSQSHSLDPSQLKQTASSTDISLQNNYTPCFSQVCHPQIQQQYNQQTSSLKLTLDQSHKMIEEVCLKNFVMGHETSQIIDMIFQVPNQIPTQNANLDKIQSIFQRNSQINSLNQNQVALSEIQNFDTQINTGIFMSRQTQNPHFYEELDYNSNSKPLSPTAYLLSKQQDNSFDAKQIYFSNTLLNSKNFNFEKMTNQSDYYSDIKNQNLQRNTLTNLSPSLKHCSSTDQAQTQSQLDLEFKMNLKLYQNENQSTCEGVNLIVNEGIIQQQQQLEGQTEFQESNKSSPNNFEVIHYQNIGKDSHSSLSSYLGKIGNLITKKQSTVTLESENASNLSISPVSISKQCPSLQSNQSVTVKSSNLEDSSMKFPGLFHTRNIKAMKLKKDKLIDLALTRIKSNQKRLKKSQEEVQMLENEFLKNPIWDYQKKSELALKLNMTFHTVQKWNFDRNKKEQKQVKPQK